MTETTTAQTWHARVYAEGAADLVVEASRPMGLAALRDQIRAAGFVIADESLTPGATQAIVVHEDGTWDPWDGSGEPSGYIVDWTATANERVQDEPAIDPATVIPGDDETGALVVFDVPQHVVSAGGGIRLRHSLDAGVTVTAYRSTGEPMGYLFATPIDDDVEHVEVLPGTARLHVVADPIVEEPDSSDPEKVADPVEADAP